MAPCWIASRDSIPRRSDYRNDDFGAVSLVGSPSILATLIISVMPLQAPRHSCIIVGSHQFDLPVYPTTQQLPDVLPSVLSCPNLACRWING